AAAPAAQIKGKVEQLADSAGADIGNVQQVDDDVAYAVAVDLQERLPQLRHAAEVQSSPQSKIGDALLVPSSDLHGPIIRRIRPGPVKFIGRDDGRREAIRR